MMLAVNARRGVTQGRISRRIFVAHRMGKFLGIEETRDARQRFWLVQPAAGAEAARAVAALHSAPHKARLSGCPVGPAT